MISAALSVEQLDEFIALPRFRPFLECAGGDHQAAMELYIWNAQLAAAVFEVIHHVEVLVRNAIHRAMYQSRPDGALRSWLLDPQVLSSDEIRRVDDVVARLHRERKPPTENRVVGGLSFGFWVSILGRRYEDLWRSTLHRAFPHGGGRRNDIAGPMNRIGQLRNRAAHHEAIFSLPVAARHEDLLAVAGAVDPAARAWVSGLSRVDVTLGKRPRVAPAAVT